MGFCPYMTSNVASGSVIQQQRQVDDYADLLITQQQKNDQTIIPFTCPETTACQLWDASSAMCGAQVTPKVQQFINKFKEIVGDSADMDTLGLPTGNVLTTERNIHADMLDLINRFQDIVGAPTDKIAGADLPPASLLKIIQHVHAKHSGPPYNEHTAESGNINKLLNLPLEQILQQDMDGNGKIYGKTFQLSDPPPLLADLSKQPGFDPDVPSITVAQFLQEV